MPRAGRAVRTPGCRNNCKSVFDMISRRKDAGYMQRVEGRIAPNKRFFARPLVGHVRAGLPQPC